MFEKDASMHVFVTGASGFVGSAVVGDLIAAGHRVSGLVRSEESARALKVASATAVTGDLHASGDRAEHPGL